MNDLVSIVMLSEKKSQYLIETVRSVQAQTYENWELLYIDDSQREEGLKMMTEEKDKDSRIRISTYVYKNGPAKARTAALKGAKGRWIAFIDAGDLWKPTKLERQIAFMQEHDYAVSYTEYGVIDSLGKDQGVVISGPERIDKAKMMRCYWSQLLTVMYDRQRVGKLRIPHLSVNNGYAVMLLLAEKADCHLLNECLATQRITSGLFKSVSLSGKFRWRYLAYRAVPGLGRIASVMRILINLWYTLVKRLKYVRKE